MLQPRGACRAPFVPQHPSLPYPNAARHNQIPPTLIIDIGANVGDTSSSLMSHFSSADCHRFWANVPQKQAGAFDRCTSATAIFVAYEPMPANYGVLQQRATFELWAAANWTGYQMALTSPELVPPSGKVQFFTSAVEGDQHGSMAAGAAGGGGVAVDVAASTLDAHLEKIGHGATPISLLKIDAEGFDPQVLLGAAGALKAGRAAYVTFEYNDKWGAVSDRSLANVIESMSTWGYDCYYVTPGNLIPIFGAWWDAAHEIKFWSNVMCHRHCDAESLRLVVHYNEDLAPERSDCT